MRAQKSSKFNFAFGDPYRKRGDLCHIQRTPGYFGRVCIYGYKFVKHFIGTAEMQSYIHLLTLIFYFLVNSIYCSESEQVKKIEMP